jgi:uncharacterized protein with PhoU and TrkA domain
MSGDDAAQEEFSALERRVEVLQRVVPPDALALLSLRSQVQALDEVLGTPETEAAYERIFGDVLDQLAKAVVDQIDAERNGAK